jgi:hypothetical protein
MDGSMLSFGDTNYQGVAVNFCQNIASGLTLDSDTRLPTYYRSIHVEMALIHFALFAVSAGSFLALGPPAAPPAQFMNSSMETAVEVRNLLDMGFMAQPSNFSVPNRQLNASSMEEKDVIDMAASYWFLADTKFKHKVSRAKIQFMAFVNIRESNHTQDPTIQCSAMLKTMVQKAMAAQMTGQQ